MLEKQRWGKVIDTKLEREANLRAKRERAREAREWATLNHLTSLFPKHLDVSISRLSGKYGVDLELGRKQVEKLAKLVKNL